MRSMVIQHRRIQGVKKPQSRAARAMANILAARLRDSPYTQRMLRLARLVPKTKQLRPAGGPLERYRKMLPENPRY